MKGKSKQLFYAKSLVFKIIIIKYVVFFLWQKVQQCDQISTKYASSYLPCPITTKEAEDRQLDLWAVAANDKKKMGLNFWIVWIHRASLCGNMHEEMSAFLDGLQSHRVLSSFFFIS